VVVDPDGDKLAFSFGTAEARRTAVERQLRSLERKTLN
jgi:hypothetical protein